MARHGPRDSGRAQLDSGEATRLMVDELQQRGVGIRTANDIPGFRVVVGQDRPVERLG